MGTKKRLIDANALRKYMCFKCNDEYSDEPCEPSDCVFYNAIKYAPTVDVVELPCKIGDRVWCIRNYKGHKHPQDGIVSEMFFGEDMRLHIVVKHIARGEWGKEIFATREDAVAAIVGERKDNE